MDRHPRAGADYRKRWWVTEGRVVFDARPDGTPRKGIDVTRLRQLGWYHEISLEAGALPVLTSGSLENRNGSGGDVFTSGRFRRRGAGDALISLDLHRGKRLWGNFYWASVSTVRRRATGCAGGGCAKDETLEARLCTADAGELGVRLPLAAGRFMASGSFYDVATFPVRIFNSLHRARLSSARVARRAIYAAIPSMAVTAG